MHAFMHISILLVYVLAGMLANMYALFKHFKFPVYIPRICTHSHVPIYAHMRAHMHTCAQAERFKIHPMDMLKVEMSIRSYVYAYTISYARVHLY